MTNTDLDWLDEILGCIVSQEAITEGGWAEYTTDPVSIAHGNQLHNKEELKLAITSHIEEAVREARKGWHKSDNGRCLVWNDKEQIYERLAHLSERGKE